MKDLTLLQFPTQCPIVIAP